MPATDSSRTAIWPLPRFDHIEITYTTKDRYGPAAWGLNPDEQHAQMITGEIVGLVYDDSPSGVKTRTPLGTVELATIGVYESGDLVDLLDSNSDQWTNYADVARQLEDGDPENFPFVRSLVIVDRIELRPDARGHGLGLHVLARAIQTWCPHDVVVLTAWTDADGAERKAGAEALARYFSRLGLKRLPGHDEPVLLGNATKQTFVDNISAWAGTWESPDEAPGPPPS
jgi:GNAT superfamily N-acetyltransferase